MSDPGPTHQPYGQDPYGQQPGGQPSPYGQQPVYGQPYGQQPAGRRPGTVTAAAWITIVFSAITAVLFGFTALALLVARDQVITEMERVPEFQDANIDAESAVGVIVAVILGLVVWLVAIGPLGAAGSVELALLCWLSAAAFILLVEESPI